MTILAVVWRKSNATAWGVAESQRAVGTTSKPRFKMPFDGGQLQRCAHAAAFKDNVCIGRHAKRWHQSRASVHDGSCLVCGPATRCCAVLYVSNQLFYGSSSQQTVGATREMREPPFVRRTPRPYESGDPTYYGPAQQDIHQCNLNRVTMFDGICLNRRNEVKTYCPQKSHTLKKSVPLHHLNLIVSDL